MLFLFLLCCHLHKVSLVGVVDSTSDDRCMIEIASGNVITVESKLCQHAREGEKVLFYLKKERR